MKAGSNASATASRHNLIAWRMHALGLGSLADSPTTSPQNGGADRVREVVQRLFALQGQDWNASRWAIGVRAPGITETDAYAAFNDGSLVRSWPMRGTIHVLAAEDIGWMQAATNKRVLAGAAKRRAFLGLDDATLHRMTDIAVTSLAGGNSLSRDELAALWTAAGIGDPEKGVGPWRYHVVWWLCQNGITVPGPIDVSTTVGEPRLVLADEWIRTPRQLEGDAALAELAHRFTRGRGPVQEKDLVWWAGLGVRDVRRGFAAAESLGVLTTIEVDGLRYWVEPQLLDSPATITDESLLLPGFDEHLLGYADRSAVLAPENFERIVPGRNGMFRATVVEEGRVTGVWTRTVRAKSVGITIEAFSGETIDVTRLENAASAWGAFTENDYTISVN